MKPNNKGNMLPRSLESISPPKHITDDDCPHTRKSVGYVWAPPIWRWTIECQNLT